jgi:hypothetical protein
MGRKLVYQSHRTITKQPPLPSLFPRDEESPARKTGSDQTLRHRAGLGSVARQKLQTTGFTGLFENLRGN